MKRGLIIGGLVLAVVLAVVMYGIFTSLDAIVEAAIETYGSEVTQTSVTVEEVTIRVSDGHGAIKGLRVGNPTGFTNGQAFQLGEIQLVLDVGTITEDPVIVKEIRIATPKVVYELSADGSNIDAIQRNVEAYIGPGESTPGRTTEGPKLVIEKLSITGGEITVKTTALKDQALSTRLPDIQMKRIGKARGGVTPGDLAQQIVAQLTKGVGLAVATLNVAKLGSTATEAVKGARDILGGGAEGATDAVKDTGKKLKKLFD